jgi:hypothetical protein
MPDQVQNASPIKTGRRGSQFLSTVLFVAAIGFALAAVGIWYYDESRSNDDPPVPTVESGVYGLINVLSALEDAGLEAEYGRSPSTASSNQIDRPGQNLTVGDTNVFVFLYPGADGESAAASREQEAASLDPETMTLTTPSGQDVTNGEPLTVFQGANVVAVLIGGDQATKDAVRSAIEGLG